MTLMLRCHCGRLQGELDEHRAYGRAVCYCRDCQAYARFLGRPGDMLDAHGGSDIVATHPRRIRFARGHDVLACMSLSPRGILRWYAACCRTAVCNTPRSPRMAYAGVLTDLIAAPAGSLDASFGPPRIRLNTPSAQGRVAATPLAAGMAVVGIASSMAVARVSGSWRRNLFFDPASGQPVVAPQVISLQERQALY